MKQKFENHIYSYIRTSTVHQIHESQISAINDYVERNNLKITEWFEDTGSGRNKNRPGLQAMLSKLRSGDTVIVWRFDRISRSTQQLIAIAEHFEEKGIKFISINNNVDTSTKEGMLFYTIMAGYAQYEAQLIKERVEEGLLASRKKGIVGGRPRIDDEQIDKAIKMHTSNKYTFKEIKEATGVSKSTIYRRMKEMKAEEFENQFQMMLQIIDDSELLVSKLKKLMTEMEIELAIPTSGDERIEKFIKEAKKAWMVHEQISEKVEELENELT
ncbi:hypothetical protein COA01_23075 [Bacillus cereus]|uniref:recombinase family protein n=1 Tax=Bacillus cereus TaxID=1396 RepID=UPI000BFE2B73|nr:recombinase family protein [Bacillus cereus]PGP18628.1 hypothetical protein COA01_23075 [Bacillus cereus]